MKTLGALFRYFLNINTIWGLMILIAFVLCLWQHYMPVRTRLPAERVQPGDNRLTIRVMDINGGNAKAFEYHLQAGAGGLEIRDEYRKKQEERPWLVSATTTGAVHLLKWDYGGHGKYVMELNGTRVDKGPLATLGALSATATDYAEKAFKMGLGLISAMVLFLGLMKVGEDAGIVQLAARVFHPVIRFLFPQVPKDHPANGAILMNMTTSILGLGNAATPFGLKAMKELQSLNPHPKIATDAQITLLAYNTAGMALIPTMLLGARKSAGCSDPFEIIGTCLVTGAVSTITAITMAKLLARLPFFTLRAALAEEPEAGGDEEAARSMPEQQVPVAGSQEKSA